MKLKMSKNISETLQKYFTKGYKETFQKDFLYHCLKYYEKVWKRFLGKMFLWNWKRNKIFPKPCKNISQKVIRKPFKNISCIIAWNVLAKFLQRFGRGFNIVKTHFKKCYCKVLQIFLEIFLANFLYRSISWNITERFQKPFLERFFNKTENVKNYFRYLAKIFYERL